MNAAKVALGVGLGVLVGIALGMGWARLHQPTVLRPESDECGGNPVRPEARPVGVTVYHPPEPRLPAPRGTTVPAGPDEAAVALPEGLSILQLAEGHRAPEIANQQIEKYLRENKRNADSLLAAARLTGNLAYLQEALKAFPHDRRVLLDTLLLNPTMTDAERRQAIEAFRAAVPNNALGSYLSAQDHFEQGKVDAAIRDLWDSLNQSELTSFRMETWQNMTEAYLSAGFSPVSAAAYAMYSMNLPEMPLLMKLSQSMGRLQNQYLQAGDAQSAQAMAEIGLLVGQQVQESMGNWVIDELIGMRIERHFLSTQDPQAVLEPGPQIVAERLAELDHKKRWIDEIETHFSLLDSLPESEKQSFYWRTHLNGEVAAWQWLIAKHGTNGVSASANN